MGGASMVPAGGRGPVWWQHGKWLCGPLLGLGLFAWVGFLYVGVRAQRRAWKVAAAFYGLGAGVAAGLIATAFYGPDAARQSTVAGLLLVAMWVGGAVHALLANREWLAWVRAHTPSPPPPGSATRASVPGPGLVAAGTEDPWAAFVRRAESLSRRFRAAARQVAAGPLQESLRGLIDRVERSVVQARQLAGHGQVLVTARRAIDVAAVDAGLAAARHALGTDSDDPGDHERQVVEALEAQRAAADRMDEVIDDVGSRLRLIEARLGEALARVVELSVHGPAPDSDLVVSDLEALGQALDEVAPPSPPGPPTRS